MQLSQLADCFRKPIRRKFAQFHRSCRRHQSSSKLHAHQDRLRRGFYKAERSFETINKQVTRPQSCYCRRRGMRQRHKRLCFVSTTLISLALGANIHTGTNTLHHEQNQALGTRHNLKICKKAGVDKTACRGQSDTGQRIKSSIYSLFLVLCRVHHHVSKFVHLKVECNSITQHIKIILSHFLCVCFGIVAINGSVISRRKYSHKLRYKSIKIDMPQ